MTSVQRLRPAGLVNSPAFSHVAVVPPGATTIYVGGQNAVDADGALVGGDDMAAQSVRALANAKTALAAVPGINPSRPGKKVLIRTDGAGAYGSRANVTLQECMAFGDAMNDREMLGSVGRGFIMGNAMPQLKAELPHLPVIGDCRNQAVSHFLTHWLDNPDLPYSPE